jgi:hypothetical protein
MIMKSRLLVLSCSKRKRTDHKLIPAIERYDGPLFRVLRRFLRECPHKTRFLDVAIISAEYGLISASSPIRFYDHRMTVERAGKLNQQVLKELKRKLKSRRYDEVFISAGRDYIGAFTGYKELGIADQIIRVSSAGHGRMQSELYDWLWGEPPQLPVIQTASNRHEPVWIRGVKISLSISEVFDKARVYIKEYGNRPFRYQSWYVQVGDKRISPKWLVSKMTELPVGAFTTGEALRVLTSLGIEVIRA